MHDDIVRGVSGSSHRDSCGTVRMPRNVFFVRACTGSFDSAVPHFVKSTPRSGCHLWTAVQ
jgi:hypothetical protein